MSYASSSSGSVTPKLRSAFSVPAIDWNMSPSCAPASSAFICVVTCARQQFCVGMRHWRMKSPVAFRIAAVVRRIVGDRVDADDRVAAP